MRVGVRSGPVPADSIIKEDKRSDGIIQQSSPLFTSNRLKRVIKSMSMKPGWNLIS